MLFGVTTSLVREAAYCREEFVEVCRKVIFNQTTIRPVDSTLEITTEH